LTQIICHYHTFTLPKTVEMTFPADGVTLNFLRGRRTGVFPDHTLRFVSESKLWTNVSLLSYQEKFVTLHAKKHNESSMASKSYQTSLMKQ